MKNRSSVQATLKCTWQLGVAEMGFNFRSQAALHGTKRVGRGPVTPLPQRPLSPGRHVLRQAEVISVGDGVFFASHILPPAAAIVTGACH